MISVSQYIESSNNCPRCGSDHVGGDTVELDVGVAWQNVVCHNCGLSWTDEYKLINARSFYDLNTDEDVEVTA